MNLTQLKYFIEIYETQSITTASQNLFVTQPTLSTALKKLEDSLGTCLLDRKKSEYNLTEAGHLVYREGKSILNQMEALENRLQELQQSTQKEEIRLGLTTLFSLQFMEEISDFIIKNPHVKITMTQNGSHTLQKMLTEDLLDIGLVSMPNYQQDKINFEPLLNTSTTGYNVYVVMGECNPLSKRSSLSFEDLENERFSSLTTDFVLGRMLADRANDFGYQPNIVAYHNDLQILLHSLQRSNSICLLSIEYNDILNNSYF